MFFVLDAINVDYPQAIACSLPDAKRAWPRAIELYYPSNSQQRYGRITGSIGTSKGYALRVFLVQ